MTLRCQRQFWDNLRTVFKTENLSISSSMVLLSLFSKTSNRFQPGRMIRGFLCWGCFLAYKMLNNGRTSVVYFREKEIEGFQHLWLHRKILQRERYSFMLTGRWKDIIDWVYLYAYSQRYLDHTSETFSSSKCSLSNGIRSYCALG